MFKSELEFERCLIGLLSSKKGWMKDVLKNPTEEVLIQNWANILYNNNRSIDRLGDYPLTKTEMQQLINHIEHLRTPLEINKFINGKTCTIKRDNPDDKLHFGKDVNLKIYDRDEIAAGQSVYQIAEQPIFKRKNPLLPDRRGDFMLLINGMPLIHVELKRSGVPISQAEFQIEKYSKEGLFAGIFSLIQIFVAMNPDDMVYFANPGPDGKFNNKFFFHWEDFNNEIVSDWEKIADQFLSIPMAHQLIGFYTVPDDTDGVLKVMRSYQYYAASKISDVVSKTDWESKKTDRGGYIWHTTGSGKTMTSFKAAQLISNSKDADKVIFLMDRVELGVQSLNEYKGFADDSDEIQATESTKVLKSKILSDSPSDILIVTSIQKMSRLKKGDTLNNVEFEKINSKRIVIIIDECHRSVFGEMLQIIRDNFQNALLFGFSGTPIQAENEKKFNNTMTIFGNELHRYSISDGIRDKNVLGFDISMVQTYSENDLRKAIGLHICNTKTVEEAMANQSKKETFMHYLDASRVPMAGYVSDSGKYIKGIEDFLSKKQYDNDKHRNKVCEDILRNWSVKSINSKYHAILATSSINEACAYYKLFKENIPKLLPYPIKVCALFDEHTDNNGDDFDKEKNLIEMLNDYNNAFGTSFTLSTYASYKKDVSRRLAHKKPYRNINYANGQTIDLLIVVNQMLTGYDSAWINALYLDKELEYENIIQAFSRTNRLNGDDKPFGIIKYYRKPFTMEKNIKNAFAIYSGHKPYGIFVDKLEENLTSINSIFDTIKAIFESNNIDNFDKNPANPEDVAKFVLEFNKLYKRIEAAKIQGFRWSKLIYKFVHGNAIISLRVNLSEEEYNILLVRYKETIVEVPPGEPPIEVIYNINTNIIENSSIKIDYDYMESKFKKYIKALQINNNDDLSLINSVFDELRHSFAFLSQDDQKIANIIIHDIQSGDLIIHESDTFNELMTTYKLSRKANNITEFSKLWGIPEDQLKHFIEESKNYSNLNEYGRLDQLLNVTNINIAIQHILDKENKKVNPIKARKEICDALKIFVDSKCMEFDE